MRDKESPFPTQMKPLLSTQNCNLADAWKQHVGNKGEHMGSCFQECEASHAVGALKEQMLCTVERPCAVPPRMLSHVSLRLFCFL